MNSTPLISYENSLREIVAVEGGGGEMIRSYN